MRETKYEKIEMKRRLYIIIGIGAALFGVAPKTLAQSVTYNHDDAKMNQITVAEIGSGVADTEPVLPVVA